MKSSVLFTFLFPVTVFAQRSQIDSVDLFVAKQVADFNIPGLALGIIKNGEVIFRKGYGINSTTDSLPVTAETIFPILSCTKAFTAAAIGILVDRGKIHWDDKVVKYLPEFKLSDPQVTRELTIGDILSHRSGLETFEGDLLWYGTSYSRQEVVEKIHYSPLRNKFRSQFGYQNVMYLVAGLIIERVTGTTWDEFVRKEILVPLSMNKTSSSTDAFAIERNYAHPHIQNQPIPLVNMDNIAPAGAVNSNIDDLLQWAQVWINHGTPLFSKSVFNAISTERIKVDKGSEVGYGYGWFVETDNGVRILSHGGGMPGYKSLIMIIPEQKTAVVVLTNKITHVNEQIAGVIIDYLAGNNVDWEKADELYGENFRFSWDEERDTTHSNVIPDWSHYTGVYEDTAYGKAVIAIYDGKAVLTLLPAIQLFTGRLYYMNRDTLKVAFRDPFISAGEVLFYEKATGKRRGFRLNIESSDFHFKYLNFVKKE